MGSVQGAQTILACTTVALGGLGYVAFELWFAPGWANGWQLGLRQSAVWPAGLALACFMVALAAGAGTGGAAGATLGQSPRFWPPAGWYRLWLLACAAGAGAIAWGAFTVLSQQANALWP